MIHVPMQLAHSYCNILQLSTSVIPKLMRFSQEAKVMR